jgi:predicted GH43/DUF377 family glycosyl hydrolase
MEIPRIHWQRIYNHPYLSPIQNSVAPAAVTTPDFLRVDGEIVYYIGGVEAGRERIIRLSLIGTDLEKPDRDLLRSAYVVLDPGPNDYDCYHVYDPATVVNNGKIYMFYTAIGKGKDSIGLAISDQGREFTKEDHPILTGRSPEVVYSQGQCYLFYVLKSPQSGYRIFGSVSQDCATFCSLSTNPIVDAGTVDSWDQYEVTTPRIFYRNGMYYMLYGASQLPDRQDMPEAFGLARSRDLTHWDKYPYNPIFQIGSSGAWDDGAIWFGTVFEWNDSLYLIYEGGQLADIIGQTPALTQVGLARLPCADFDRALAEW